MAFGDYVKSTTGSASSGDVTVTFTATEGNLLILSGKHDANQAAPAAPAGWSVIGLFPGWPAQTRFDYWYRIAGASDTTVTIPYLYTGSTRGIVSEYEFDGTADPSFSGNVDHTSNSQIDTAETPTGTPNICIALRSSAWIGGEGTISINEGYSKDYTGSNEQVCSLVDKVGATQPTFSFTGTNYTRNLGLAVFHGTAGGSALPLIMQQM